MQVSWIDADQIKALVAQIEMPALRMEETPEMVELDTVPADSSEAWGFAVEREAPPVRPALPPAPPAPEKQAASVPVAPPAPARSEPRPAFASDPDDEPSEDGEIGQPLQSPASALPLSRIRDKLRAIRQRAADAGILTRANGGVQADTAPSAVQDPVEDAPQAARVNGAGSSSTMPVKVARAAKTVFETPRGSREVRLAAFAGWARQVLREDGGGQVLVMRDDGEVLWGGGEAKSGLALSTMMACGAAIRASVLSARETPAVIHQPLASGNVLTVIPCETSGGIVHAAVAAPTGLSHEQAHQLRGALCAAMN